MASRQAKDKPGRPPKVPKLAPPPQHGYIDEDLPAPTPAERRVEELELRAMHAGEVLRGGNYITLESHANHALRLLGQPERDNPFVDGWSERRPEWEYLLLLGYPESPDIRRTWAPGAVRLGITFRPGYPMSSENLGTVWLVPDGRRPPQVEGFWVDDFYTLDAPPQGMIRTEAAGKWKKG